MKTPNVIRDGMRVTILVSDFGHGTLGNQAIWQPVRAFAIGDHAVVRARSFFPDGDDPPFDVKQLGWLRSNLEGVRWCRGWKGKSVRALLAQLALETSR